jgi:hypothetical protein
VIFSAGAAPLKLIHVVLDKKMDRVFRVRKCAAPMQKACFLPRLR